jgi:hypothetical protein
VYIMAWHGIELFRDVVQCWVYVNMVMKIVCCSKGGNFVTMWIICQLVMKILYYRVICSHNIQSLIVCSNTVLKSFLTTNDYLYLIFSKKSPYCFWHIHTRIHTVIN